MRLFDGHALELIYDMVGNIVPERLVSLGTLTTFSDWHHVSVPNC